MCERILETQVITHDIALNTSTATQVLQNNPRRRAVIINQGGGDGYVFYMSSDLGVPSFLTVQSVAPSMVLLREELGILVTQEWWAINQGGIDLSITEIVDIPEA